MDADALLDALLGRSAAAPAAAVQAQLERLSVDRAAALFDLASPAPAAPGALEPPPAATWAGFSEPAKALARDAAALLQVSLDRAAALVAATPGVDAASTEPFRPLHLSALRVAHLRQRLACLQLLEGVFVVAAVEDAPFHAPAAALAAALGGSRLVEHAAAALRALFAPVTAVPAVDGLSVFAQPGLQQHADAFAGRHARLLAAWRVGEACALLRMLIALLGARQGDAAVDPTGVYALAAALHATAFSVPAQQRALALSLGGGAHDGGGGGVRDVAADIARLPHLAVMALLAGLRLPAVARVLLGGAGAGPLADAGDRRTRDTLTALAVAAEAWICASIGRMPSPHDERYGRSVLALAADGSGSATDATGLDVAVIADAAAAFAAGAAAAGAPEPHDIATAAAACPYVPVLVGWSALIAAASGAAGAAAAAALNTSLTVAAAAAAPQLDNSLREPLGGDVDEELLQATAMRRVSPLEPGAESGGTPVNLTSACRYLATALNQLHPSTAATGAATGGLGLAAALLRDTDALDVAGSADGLDRLARLLAAGSAVAEKAASAASATATAAALAAMEADDEADQDGGADGDGAFDIDDVMKTPADKAAAEGAAAGAAAADAATDAVVHSPVLLRAAVEEGTLEGASGRPGGAIAGTGGSLDPSHDALRLLARQLPLAVTLARFICATGPDGAGVPPVLTVPGLPVSGGDGELGALLALVSAVYKGDTELCESLWAGLEADAVAASSGDANGGGGAPAGLPANEPLGRWVLGACVARAPLQLSPLCRFVAAVTTGQAAASAASRFLADAMPSFTHLAPHAALALVPEASPPNVALASAAEGAGALSASRVGGGNAAAAAPEAAAAVYARLPLHYATEGVTIAQGAQGTLTLPPPELAAAGVYGLSPLAFGDGSGHAQALAGESGTALPVSPSPGGGAAPLQGPLALVTWPVPVVPLQLVLGRLSALVPALAQLAPTMAALESAASPLASPAAYLAGTQRPSLASTAAGGDVTDGASLRATLVADGGVASRGLVPLLEAAVGCDVALRDVVPAVDALSSLLYHAPSAALGAVSRTTSSSSSSSSAAASATGDGLHRPVSALVRAAAMLLTLTLPAASAASAASAGTPPAAALALSRLRLQAQAAALSALQLLAAATAGCASITGGPAALVTALASRDTGSAMVAALTTGLDGGPTLGTVVLGLCATAGEQLPQPLASAALLATLRFVAGTARASIALGTHDVMQQQQASAGTAAAAPTASPSGGGDATMVEAMLAAATAKPAPALPSASSSLGVTAAAGLVEACADVALRSLVRTSQALASLQAALSHAAASAPADAAPPPLAPQQALLRKHCWLAATRSIGVITRLLRTRAPHAAGTRERVAASLAGDASVSRALVYCATALAAHATPRGAPVLPRCDFSALGASLAVDEQLLLQGLTVDALQLLRHVLAASAGGGVSASARADMLLATRVAGLAPPDVDSDGQQPSAGEVAMDGGAAADAAAGAASTGLHVLIAYSSYAVDTVPAPPADGASYMPAPAASALGGLLAGTAAGSSVSLAALQCLTHLVRVMAQAGREAAAAATGADASDVQRLRLHYDASAHLVGQAPAVRTRLLPGLGDGPQSQPLPSLQHAAAAVNLARQCMDGQHGLLQALLHTGDADDEPEDDGAQAKRVRFTGVNASTASLTAVGFDAAASPAPRGLVTRHPSVLELALQVVLTRGGQATSAPHTGAQLRLIHASLALLLQLWRSAAEDGLFARAVARTRAVPGLWPAVVALAQPLGAPADEHADDDGGSGARAVGLCVQAAALDLLSAELLWTGVHHDAAHRRRRRSSTGVGAGADAVAGIHALFDALTPLLTVKAADILSAAGASPSGGGEAAAAAAPSGGFLGLLQSCGSLPASALVVAGSALRHIAAPPVLSAYQAGHEVDGVTAPPKAQFGLGGAAPTPLPAAPHHHGHHHGSFAATLFASIPAPTSVSRSPPAAAGDAAAAGTTSLSRCDPSALGRSFVYDVDALAADAGHAGEWLELLAGAAPREVREAVAAAVDGDATVGSGAVMAPSGDIGALHAHLRRLGAVWLTSRWNGAASQLAASADAMAAWQGLLAAASRVGSLVHSALPPAAAAACAVYLLRRGVAVPEASSGAAALPPGSNDASVAVTCMVTAAEAATVLLGSALESSAAHPSTAAGSDVSAELQLLLLRAANDALARLEAVAPAGSPAGEETPALRLRLLLLSLVLTVVNRLSTTVAAAATPTSSGTASGASTPAATTAGASAEPTLAAVLTSLATHACDCMSAAARGLESSLAAPATGGGGSVPPTLAAEVYAASASFLARLLFLRPASQVPAAPLSGAAAASAGIGSPVPGLSAGRTAAARGSADAMPLPPLLSPAQVTRLLGVLQHSFVTSAEAVAAALGAHEESWLRRLAGLVASAKSAGPAAAGGGFFGAPSSAAVAGGEPALAELRSLTPAHADLPPEARPQLALIRLVAQLSMRLALQLALRYSAATTADEDATAFTGAQAVVRCGLLASITRSSLFRRMEATLQQRAAAGLGGYPFPANDDDKARLTLGPEASAAADAPRGGSVSPPPAATPAQLARALRELRLPPSLAFAASGFGFGPSHTRGYEGHACPERCALAATWADALGVLAHAARGAIAAAAAAPSPAGDATSLASQLARAAVEAVVDAVGGYRTALQGALLLVADVTFAGAHEAAAASDLLAVAYSTAPVTSHVEPVLAAIGLPAGNGTTSPLDAWLARGGGGGGSGAGAVATFAVCGEYLVRDTALLLGNGEGGPSTAAAAAGGQSAAPASPLLLSAAALAARAPTETADAGSAARDHLAYRFGVHVVAVSPDERRAESRADLWRKVRRSLLQVPAHARRLSRGGFGGSTESGGADCAGAAAAPAPLQQPKSILKHAAAAGAGTTPLQRSTLSPGGLLSRSSSYFPAAAGAAAAGGAPAADPLAGGGAASLQPLATVLPMRSWRHMVEAALLPALAGGLTLCAAAAQARSTLHQRVLAAAQAAACAAPGGAGASTPRRHGGGGAEDIRTLAWTHAKALVYGAGGISRTSVLRSLHQQEEEEAAAEAAAAAAAASSVPPPGSHLLSATTAPGGASSFFAQAADSFGRTMTISGAAAASGGFGSGATVVRTATSGGGGGAVGVRTVSFALDVVAADDADSSIVAAPPPSSLAPRAAAGASPLPADVATLQATARATHARLADAFYRSQAGGVGDDGTDGGAGAAGAGSVDAAATAAAAVVSSRALFTAWPAADGHHQHQQQQQHAMMMVLSPEDAVAGGRWLCAQPGPGHVLSAVSFALKRAALLLPAPVGTGAAASVGSGGPGSAASTPGGASGGGGGGAVASSPLPAFALRSLAHPADAAALALLASTTDPAAVAASPLTGKTAALTAVAPMSLHTLQAVARAGVLLLAPAVDELSRDARLTRNQAVSLMTALAATVGDGGLELRIATATAAAAGGAGEEADAGAVAGADASATPARGLSGGSAYSSASSGTVGRRTSFGVGSPMRVDSSGTSASGGGVCTPSLLSPSGAAVGRAASGGSSGGPARRLSGGLFRASLPPSAAGGGGLASLLGGASGTPDRDHSAGDGGSHAASQLQAARRALDTSRLLHAVLGGAPGDGALLAVVLPALVLSLSARVPEEPHHYHHHHQHHHAADPIGSRLLALPPA